jgi:hypothetical protein
LNEEMAMADDPNPLLEGGCTCGAVRYRLASAPLIVHCCHCRWCQRETGSAFVLNAMIETSRLGVTAGEPIMILTPSASGKGQKILRCPTCQVALWSHYPGGGDRVAFVRAGTLDEPDRCPPDIHIFTESKQPWVQIPQGMRSVAEFYEIDEVWSPASLERRRALRATAAG